MNDQPPTVPVVPAPAAAVKPRSSWKKKALIVTSIILGSATLAAAGTAWWVKRNIYASPFSPVVLAATEQAALNGKLEALKQSGELNPAVAPTAPVDPEVEKRTLTLSDREINAFLKEQGLGEQIKVSLHNGGGTATFLLPLNPEQEVGKGATVRISVSLGAKMGADKKFALSLTDVSVGGLPLPNAWLGDIKGLNLLADSPVSDDPVFKAFAAGIRDFNIQSGVMRVVLNE